MSFLKSLSEGSISVLGHHTSMSSPLLMISEFLHCQNAFPIILGAERGLFSQETKIWGMLQSKERAWTSAHWSVLPIRVKCFGCYYLDMIQWLLLALSCCCVAHKEMHSECDWTGNNDLHMGKCQLSHVLYKLVLEIKLSLISKVPRKG